MIEGSPTTRDFRLNRVRIFHNDKNIVISVPRRGWYILIIESISIILYEIYILIFMLYRNIDNWGKQ